MVKQLYTDKVGREDDLVFYKWRDICCCRQKSSLSGKTVLTAKAFENTRKSASQLAQAARLSSSLYTLLPKDQKERKVYQHLTGQIKLQLKKGKTEEEITTWFNLYYLNINMPLVLPKPSLKAILFGTSTFWLKAKPVKKKLEKQPLFKTLAFQKKKENPNHTSRNFASSRFRGKNFPSGEGGVQKKSKAYIAIINPGHEKYNSCLPPSALISMLLPNKHPALSL